MIEIEFMYTGAALSFGLIRACRSGLVLYCTGVFVQIQS